MLLSRLAETVFWFGRYVERAENMARAILAHEQLCLDMPRERSPGWLPLLSLCGAEPASWPRGCTSEPEGVLRFLISDRQNPSSLLSTMTRAREDLRLTRPIVPKETWHTLNGAYLSLLNVEASPSLVAHNHVLTDVMCACQQLSAQIAAMMTHDHAYAFLRVGRHIERADMLLRITSIRHAFERDVRHGVFHDVLWMGLLRSLGAYQMYRRQHHGRVDASRAFAFLLGDPQFPRSLEHCVAQVERELAGLPHGASFAPACARCRPLALPSPHAFSAVAYADERLAALAALSDAIGERYFSCAPQA